MRLVVGGASTWKQRKIYVPARGHKSNCGMREWAELQLFIDTSPWLAFILISCENFRNRGGAREGALTSLQNLVNARDVHLIKAQQSMESVLARAGPATPSGNAPIWWLIATTGRANPAVCWRRWSGGGRLRFVFGPHMGWDLKNANRRSLGGGNRDDTKQLRSTANSSYYLRKHHHVWIGESQRRFEPENQ